MPEREDGELAAYERVVGLVERYRTGATDLDESEALVAELHALRDRVAPAIRPPLWEACGSIELDLYARWVQVDHLKAGVRDLERAVQLAPKGADWLEHALATLADARNDWDDYLREPEARMTNARLAVGDARRAARLAELRLGRPDPDRLVLLARVVRLRALHTGTAKDTHEALALVETAQRLTVAAADPTDGAVAGRTYLAENLRGLCLKDLRKQGAGDLDAEVAAFRRALAVAAEADLPLPSSARRNLAIALAARATERDAAADRAEAFSLFRSILDEGEPEPHLVELTVANWWRTAQEAGERTEVRAACEAGVDALLRFVRAQRAVDAARAVVVPLGGLGLLLAAEHLEGPEPDLWRAAAAVDRTRSLLLQADPDPTDDASEAVAVATLRAAAARRNICYLIPTNTAVHVLLFRGDAEPAWLRAPCEPTTVGEMAGRYFTGLGAFMDDHAAVPAFEEVLHAVGRELWDLVFAWVVPRLPRDAELAVVPAGMFGYLPLGIARSADGDHLVDHLAVSSQLSVRRLVAAERAHRRASGPVLVLGAGDDPDAELPAVDEECAAVVDVWTRTGRPVDEGSTADDALQHLPAADVVHVAGHAYQDLDDGFRSVLRLGDRDLVLGELVGRELSASLVFLAACGSGTRGDVSVPHEAISIASIVQRLGAGTVVGTEWMVFDQVAAAISVLFYEGLLELGLPATQALRRAQRCVRAGDVLQGSLSRRYLADVADDVAAMGPTVACWATFSVYGADFRVGP